MFKISPLKSIKIRPRLRRRGSVAVEFVIIAPFLVWITFAVCEYGIVINTKSTLTQLARDGGRYAAIHATEASAYGNGKTPNSIRSFIENESSNTSVVLTQAMEVTSPPAIQIGNIDPATGAFSVGTPNTPGQQVAVLITYSMKSRLWGTQLVPGLTQFTTTPTTKLAVFIIEKPSQ